MQFIFVVIEGFFFLQDKCVLVNFPTQRLVEITV